MTILQYVQYISHVQVSHTVQANLPVLFLEPHEDRRKLLQRMGGFPFSVKHGRGQGISGNIARSIGRATVCCEWCW